MMAHQFVKYSDTVEPWLEYTKLNREDHTVIRVQIGLFGRQYKLATMTGHRQ